MCRPKRRCDRKAGWSCYAVQSRYEKMVFLKLHKHQMYEIAKNVLKYWVPDIPKIMYNQQRSLG